MCRGTIAAVLGGILAAGLVGSAAEPAGRSQNKGQGGPIRAVSAQATPLFVSRDGGLRRIVEVKVDLAAPVKDLTLRVAAGKETAEVRVPQAVRTLAQDVELPDMAEPTDCRVTVTAGGQSQSTGLTLRPQRKWRIFLAPNSHTDIGYTHVQPECAERHNHNLDLSAELCRRYPDFKWNCEVAWQVENYLASRKKEQIDEFLRLARGNRLGVQALYVNILTGLCSHEEFCRLNYFAAGLHRREGIPYSSAIINDVPTCVAATPMMLANSGIRYFANGINITRAFTFDRMYEKSPCWWEGPDGSRVLMMFVPSIAAALRMGFHDSLDAARQRTLKHLADYEARTAYPYDAVFFNGASNDNCFVEPKMPEIVAQWNKRYAFPKVIFCTGAEFFEYIEKHYGADLPVVRGSGGTYWEDGAGSSARETAMVRNAHEAIDAAERLWAVFSRLRAEPAYPRQSLDSAWRNCLLYDEHTWGANTVGTKPEGEFTKAQWAIKRGFAEEALRGASESLRSACQAMASLVRTDGDSLVVFNTSSWPRTDVVELQLPENRELADPVATSIRLGNKRLVAVRDVPPMGYRVLRFGSKPKAPAAAPREGTTIESRFYRARFDPASGAIESLIDKESGRELVDRNPDNCRLCFSITSAREDMLKHNLLSLNQYLYVSGGKDSRIVDLRRYPKPAELSVATPQKATLQRMDLGPLGERMIVETSAPMTPRITSEITVWNDLKRVDIVNRLTKTLTYDKEAVYFAFPFAAHKPVLRYEEPAAIVRPDRDFLPGACLDWLTVQHFAELDAGDAAICWSTPDAPLVCFQDINRGKWQDRFTAANGHLYAYVMNNYWYTNYLAGQGGEFTFRFAITSRPKADKVASARFGWEAASPLQARVAPRNPAGPLPPGSASLLQIAQPNVLLVGMKRAEAGDGLVVRLWEVQGQATTAELRFPGLAFKKATLSSLVEQPQQPLEIRQSAVAVPIRGSGLATVVLE